MFTAPLTPQVRAMLDKIRQAALPPLYTLPVEQARASYRNGVGAMEQPQVSLERVEDFTIPGPAGVIPARLWASTHNPGLPLLLYFHGGGFVVGNIESCEGMCRQIALQSGAAVIAIDYRLAPEHKFPAGIDDALAIADWALGNVDNLGGNRDRILVGGDSAGGNLSAVVAQQTAGREQGFSGQVLMYPVLDMGGDYPSRQEHADGPVLTETAARWFHELYLSESDETTDPRISPIHFPELGSLVPAVVATAGFDILRDEGFEYVKRLEAAGVPTKHLHFETLPHGFLGFGPLSAGADAAISEVSSAIAELARTGAAA